RARDRASLQPPKSHAAPRAILAGLRADAVYAPLDPGSPVPRLEKMIASCDNRWILASGAVGPTVEALFALPGFGATHAVGWVGTDEPPAGVPAGFMREDAASQRAAATAREGGGEDPAHDPFPWDSTRADGGGDI